MDMEELFGTLRLFLCSLSLSFHDELWEATQDLLTEIHFRDNSERPLLSELEQLCISEIITPYFVLSEAILYGIFKEGGKTLVNRLIESNNLRNWINYTYTAKLSRNIIPRITTKDVDIIENAIRSGIYL